MAGASQEVLDRIAAIERRIEDLKVRKETRTEYSLVISAKEKNADANGTIMNMDLAIETALKGFINEIKVESKIIDYDNASKKGEFRNKVDNTATVVGNKLTPYAIIFRDSIGDSPYMVGSTLFFGYCCYGDGHGAQMLINYQHEDVFRRTTQRKMVELESDIKIK